MAVACSMDVVRSNQLPTGAGEALRVIVAYDDATAGQRAMRVVADQALAWKEVLEFRPLPWTSELPAEVDWGHVAATQVVKADLLILAKGAAAAPVPTSVNDRTAGVTRPARRTAAAVVALFSRGGRGVSRRHSILSAARAAGFEIFTPTARSELMDVVELCPRWGINE